jgi:hypothetical protein
MSRSIHYTKNDMRTEISNQLDKPVWRQSSGYCGARSGPVGLRVTDKDYRVTCGDCIAKLEES